MVKKIILYTLVIIALAAAAFWGYLWFSRWQSFRLAIPARSDRVVRLNLERLGTKLISDDKEQASKDPFFSKLNAAFNIPLNVFAFGAKSVSDNVFLLKLRIADEQELAAFVSEYLPKGANNFRSNAAGTISLIYNKQAAVFLIGKDGSKSVRLAANEYLNNKNTLPFSESRLYAIRKSRSDLSSLGNMYNFKVNFEAGKISGTFVNNVQDEADITLKVPKGAALALIAKDNLFAMLDKWGLSELLPGIATAELETAARQGFALYIDGETQQERAVVSYEYDDNFEKVAVTSTEPVHVPNINLKLPLAGNAGFDKLRSKGLLTGTDSFNNAVLPLWHLKYYFKASQTLHLYASARIDTNISEPVTLDRDADLLAWVDFEQLATYNSLSDFRQLLSGFKRLDVKHDSEELYTLELSFKDERRNALRQLIRMITTKEGSLN